MKRILILLPAFLLAGLLFAQSGDDFFQRADSLYVAGIELYNNEDYLAAAELFEQCYSLNKAGEREEPYCGSDSMNRIVDALEKAFENMDPDSGDDDGKYFSLIEDLAYCLECLGEYSEAVVYRTEALKMAESFFWRW